ncbi:fatty acid desaturase [Lichenibacterium ramalinae]|uniref:Fatty acid desaturase n=1 Tax=Lichenibacterium ramalinae TaxID=2316527 RepID=A0A4V1RIL0_9HYPH|nr:fatty acid desaturase [Lichenibacterium ramalinae]RYB04381.1 fatty acid desaturase [Lichenibacterium ramalinae]
MTTNVDSNSPSVSAKAWMRVLARYREPSPGRSAAEIALTAVPLLALWVAMWLCLQVSCWLCLALAPLAAAFLVRLFLIEHDCSHDACFRTRAANDWVGRVIGVFTLTPYDYWRRTHAIHHATVGNLDQRGIGDVTTLTVAEYKAASRTGRLLYRLYRHPVVMFGLGPAWLFLVQYRLPIGLMRAGWKPWASTMGTTAATASLVAGLVWWLGVAPVLLIPLPVLLVAASAGVWLFYVQHQFEETNWSAAPDWTHAEAALHGSSHYDLPLVLRWLTANIGLHHVHHLSSRIPFYRLPEVMRDHPELRDVGRITLSASLRCVPLVLWDEGNRRLVSFETARRTS